MSSYEYRCKICNKSIKLLKSHIRQHSKTLEEYLNECNDYEVKQYEVFMELTKRERQENSPNSIYFYIKKGLSVEDAKMEHYNYNLKNPFFRKDVSPTQIKYWLNKGFGKEEATEKIRLACSNSLESLIIKYGEVDGKKRYDNIKKIHKSKHFTLINNLMVVHNIDFDKAYIMYCKRMCDMSPSSTVYWTKQGFSEEDARNKITEYGRKKSPRCINYWLIKTNNNIPEATNLLKKYQDNTSIESIMCREKCGVKKAISIQLVYIENVLNGMIDSGHIFKLYKNEFLEYQQKVRNKTNITYKRNKSILDPYNLRGSGFHLDHKYSIYQGFLDGIDVEIISSIYNLEIIKQEDNIKKYTKCSINKNNLISNYENRNKL